MSRTTPHLPAPASAASQAPTPAPAPALPDPQGYQGQAYWYPTPNAGLCALRVVPRGHDYVVSWADSEGAEHRLHTPHLPPMEQPYALQRALDRYAYQRRLCPVPTA